MSTKKTESAGGIVVNANGQVLLVEQQGHVWSLPKGHLEGSETPLEAASREIVEEAGLKQFEMKKELGFYERYKIAQNGGDDTSELKVIHMFLFTTKETDAKPQDPHILSARWFEPQAVAEYLHHPKDKVFYLETINRFSSEL